MIERILQIIVYVVQELHRSNSLNEAHFSSLNNQGYTDAEISTAISWLADDSHIEAPEIKNRKAFRILSNSEREIFDEDAFSYLIRLNTLGILNNEQIDFIIDRAIFAEIPIIDKNTLNNIVTAFFIQKHPNPNGDFSGRTMLSGKETIN